MELSTDFIIDIINSTTIGIKHFQFGAKAQLAFLEDLYTLVNDGIPPNRAIDMLVHVTTGVNKDVAISISQKLAEGQSLAEGMREWFSVSVTEIIRVGEEGGALAQTMKSAINTLSQRSGSMGALFAAITYPILVIVMACGVILFLDHGVFTEFQKIKPMEQWPDAGREVVLAATLIKYWWWIIVAFFVVIITVVRRIMKNYTGELRPLIDKIPPFSFYKKFEASRFLETLGLLIENGVVFKNAIKVMQYQANPYMASHLVMMEHLLSMGKGNVADVLSTGLVEEQDILRLRVMAEVKGFEHGLVRIGVHGAEQNTKTLKLISRVIGGLLLMVGAALIVMIVRGIFLTGMALGTP